MKYILLFLMAMLMAVPAYADNTDNSTTFTFDFNSHEVSVNGVEYIPKPQDFTSLEELELFLEADDTDSHIFLTCGADGKVAFNNQCEDLAFQLRDRAEDIGKRLETEVLDRNEYYKWYRIWLPKDTYHVIVKAVIGNDWYYIEPGTDKCWIGLYLD